VVLADLKAYRDDPCRKRRTQLRARFERIFKRRTGFVTLDRLLARPHARKNELLLVLDRPEIRSIPTVRRTISAATVTKRKVSGGTWSAAGRAARDAGLGLMKTCHKQASPFSTISAAASASPERPLSRPFPTCSAPAPPPARLFAPLTRALAS
jgi:hypothetical protein